jgi:hypothetical protein
MVAPLARKWNETIETKKSKRKARERERERERETAELPRDESGAKGSAEIDKQH